MEREKGIEPSLPACPAFLFFVVGGVPLTTIIIQKKREKAGVLPLNIFKIYSKYGAGDENRTHVTSLEGWSSTIELRPRY